MKKYTHAWIAFKAIERIEKAPESQVDPKISSSLIKWFKDRKDGVISGAWYPDAIIKDNANSHVMKFSPAETGADTFKALPATMQLYQSGKQSALYKQPYTVDPDDNLPARCEALAHSVIDNLRVQQTEARGSPIAPTDNHIALILFMLSHYVADAHMPLHCDSRKFSQDENLHAEIEGRWESEVKEHFSIDYTNERFFYDPKSSPLFKKKPGYKNSILMNVENQIRERNFVIDYGQGNSSVMDYMFAVCQYSYLLSYRFIPRPYDETTVTLANWQALEGQQPSFENLSVIVLTDAIDSVARIWLRVWRRYIKWKENTK